MRERIASEPVLLLLHATSGQCERREWKFDVIASAAWLQIAAMTSEQVRSVGPYHSGKNKFTYTHARESEIARVTE